MKANRKYKESEEAVSAVIGVILMVAITVAIAATVYVYVSGMIGGGQQQTPTISCTTDNAGDKIIISSADSSTSWTDITLSNDSGSNCVWVIWYNGGATEGTNNTMPSATLTAGDYIEVLAPADAGNVKFTFRYDPTNTLMGSWTVYV